ncbi:MAG: phenol hydroxylase subunit [Rhodocyclales bacterium]|nr:phenol hydroxylase subunit [Rhodocyclales bacterium]
MQQQTFDPTRKYVRVTGQRSSGPVALVEFEFSVGEPALAVELIMPEAAFAQFCADNQVIFLDTAPTLPAGDGADFGWNLHAATHQRFR